MARILSTKKMRLLVMAGIGLAVFHWLGGPAPAKDLRPIVSEENQIVQVKVHRLIFEPISKQPVVILSDPLGERGLPIWIDFFEANAINSELQGITHFRPLTHDLLERFIKKSDLKIHRIIVTELKEGVYYATIQVEREGTLSEIDARPSDSIVMALKFKAPIFVSKSLFRDKSVPLTEPEEFEEKYGLKLQDLTPSLAQSFSFRSTGGTLVSDVREGSQAEKDGILRGDIFVEVGEKAIEDLASMRDALKSSKTGVQARIFRKAHYVSITLHPE
jgi:bifunctional DNase/RNase